MARKHQTPKRGRVVTETHVSRVLRNNRLGDPHERTLAVYLPHAYDDERRRHRRFPVLFDLVGYTASGLSHVNWRNFDENVPDRLDRLIATGKMPPTIVAFPDCFTALGGNQYINSSAIGRYADYLVDELIGFVDAKFRTLAAREHRGCFGKSSGGYGAIVHGMKYAEHWGAVGNHSGDAYFDFVYRAEWPAVLTALQRFAHPTLKAGVRGPKATAKPKTRGPKTGFDDGRVARFLEHCWSNEQPSGNDIMTLMMICMAATYDPDPSAPLGFRLPFDLDTGVEIPRRWQKWLAHDPVHLIDHSASRRNLKKLNGIYIDCGWRDQFHIHYGSRQLAQGLARYGISHRYEEFDDNHSGIDYRMDVSLPYLAKRLA